MLPAPLREEPVVAAGDDLCAVIERDPVGGFTSSPESFNFRFDKVSVAAIKSCSYNFVTDSDILQRFLAPVSH